VFGGVEDDELETFYRHVMGTVASFSNELKGHKRTEVFLWDEEVAADFKRRFLAEQAALNFSGGPYKVSLTRVNTLVVERRK